MVDPCFLRSFFLPHDSNIDIFKRELEAMKYGKGRGRAEGLDHVSCLNALHQMYPGSVIELPPL
jgi:hypothetical protein